jgi:hypothetical protein
MGIYPNQKLVKRYASGENQSGVLF